MLDYELIDTGNRQKLERWGKLRIIRPEPLAVWPKTLVSKSWQTQIAAEYQASSAKIGAGHWQFSNPQLAEQPPIITWQPSIDVKTASPISPQSQSNPVLNFQLKFMPSRHLGLFPEHAPQWLFIFDQINIFRTQYPAQEFHLLNLFGFTGAASLTGALAGAQVTHVDSSYEAISLGRRNQELSNLASSPIRWLKDDVSKFVERELRRRPHFYHGIILDPPAHGHGAKKGEVWHLPTMLPDLIQNLGQLLAPQAKFLILNTYSDFLPQARIFKPLINLFSEHYSGELILSPTVNPAHTLHLSRFETFYN